MGWVIHAMTLVASHVRAPESAPRSAWRRPRAAALLPQGRPRGNVCTDAPWFRPRRTSRRQMAVRKSPPRSAQAPGRRRATRRHWMPPRAAAAPIPSHADVVRRPDRPHVPGWAARTPREGDAAGGPAEGARADPARPPELADRHPHLGIA